MGDAGALENGLDDGFDDFDSIEISTNTNQSNRWVKKIGQNFVGQNF